MKTNTNPSIKATIRSSDVFLLLGSNMGNRIKLLKDAETILTHSLDQPFRSSSYYETAAWGKTDQPAFINQVLWFKSTLKPEKLLSICLDTEKALGRVRFEKWGQRTIDIDILYIGNLRLDYETLTIPHAQLHNRRFTLVPLAEIAPDFKHPVMNKTNMELLQECQDPLEVKRVSVKREGDN